MIDRNTYYQSKEWKELKKRVILRDWNRCTKCGFKHTQLHVHHLTYERFGNENMDDLITLCADCHSDLHGRKIGNTRYFKEYKSYTKTMEKKATSNGWFNILLIVIICLIFPPTILILIIGVLFGGRNKKKY